MASSVDHYARRLTMVELWTLMTIAPGVYDLGAVSYANRFLLLDPGTVLHLPPVPETILYVAAICCWRVPPLTMAYAALDFIGF